MHAVGVTLVVHFNGACGGLESKVQHKKQITIPPDDAKAAKCTRMGGPGMMLSVPGTLHLSCCYTFGLGL